MRKADGRRLGRVLGTGVAVAALAVASGVAVAGPQITKPTIPGAKQASDHVFVMVELKQKPTAQVYREVLDSQKGPSAGAMATAAAINQLKEVREEQRRFDRSFADLGLVSAKEVYRLQRTFNGVMMQVDANDLPNIAELPEVIGIHRVTPKYLLNHHSMPFLGVPAVWENLGLLGDGIKVGVIDTGIDYIHMNFGGDGDYSVNPDATVIEADTFPTTRVVGGKDFAGTNYNPEDPALAVPVPDPDPMDFNGHGTHVSGTVGGYGVTVDDQTYAGPWEDELEAEDFKIGPGAAPLVDLYALKVFNDVDESGTLVHPLAMEWATDPNEDGNFDDHLDVVNLSLGNLYGTTGDPETLIFANAVRAGVIVVASAGNSYDVNFIAGNPGSTPEVISVAASYDKSATYQTLHVTAPTTAVADYAAAPTLFGTPLDAAGITGELAFADPPEGCDYLNNDLTGKIAVLDRGTCDISLKPLVAEIAGAIGAIIVNNAPGGAINVPPQGYGAYVTIPSVMVRQDDGNVIKGVMATELVTVNLNNTLFPALDESDSIVAFSSRGPSRSGSHVMLKPDVAAPGYNITSSWAGLGADGATMSGTSMSAPHVTGVMALLREGLPTWTPLQLKAGLMNTGHDVYGYKPDGVQVSPARAGAGRIDPGSALATSVIAYDAAAPEQVSLSFHTLDVVADTAEPRTIRLENKSSSPVTYTASYRGIVEPPGVTVTVPTTDVVVPANGTVDVTVTLEVEAAALVRTHDATLNPTGRFWLSEASGYVEFTPASGPTLRVPAFAALRPASDMSATGPVDTSGAVDGVGTSLITLAGTGLDDDPATLPDPPQAIDSMVWPFELKYRGTNDPPWFASTLPPGYDAAETDLHEIRTIGVSSTVAMGDSVADSLIFFGLETEGIWGSPTEAVFDIYLKAASAPDWQFVLYAFDSNLTDQPSQCLVDLSDGSGGCFPDMLNFVGSSIHTPVFFSDAIVQWFPAGWLGLTEADSAIEFAVAVYTPLFDYSDEATAGTYADSSPLLRYDVGHPAVAFPDGFYLDDLPTTEIAVNYDMNSAIVNHAGSVMLLHHHNAAGSRAEIVPVTGMTCVTDDDCPPSLEYRDCDPLTGACVGCFDATACLPGEFCDNTWTRACIADCRAEGANPCAPGGYCDIVTGACIGDCRQETAEPCLDGFYCHETTGQCQVANTLVVTTAVQTGDENCPNGGIQLDSGIDDDGDGVLDEDEIDETSYVCNGLETLVVTTDEEPGDNCEWGGQRIDSGVDDNGDGVLDTDEIDETSYACNGPDGFQTLVTVTDELPGDNCPAGGKRVDMGVDDDRDDVLDAAEIDETSYVCNAYTSLTTTTDIPPGEACANGGTLVETGLDANGDGELQTSEVQSHHTVCNGAPATSVAAEGGGCAVESRTSGRSGQAALGSLALLGLALVRRRRPQR